LILLKNNKLPTGSALLIIIFDLKKNEY